MSRENVDLALLMCEIFNRRDLDALLALMHGDMTLGQIRGRAHGAVSTTPVVETWWQTIRWRDGQCIGWRNFATKPAVETIDQEP